MATCIPFQTQLSSIMEVLVKAAVTEISKLVDDKCEFLHLEISRKQSENDMLKRKVLLMESKHAQLQRGFENYMDRGPNCPHPTGDMKFPEMDDVNVSFTIKEESPDETLWISDSAGPIGPAVQYRNPDNQHLPEERLMNHLDMARQKAADFGHVYNPGQHSGGGGGEGGGGGGDMPGLQFTVKTEKEEEEDRSGFGRDGCQHASSSSAAMKQTQLAADFSMDERENQLWSSIIEGDDIDDGFPDFSSVVDEYSNTYADHSDSHAGPNAPKSAPGVPQRASVNGMSYHHHNHNHNNSSSEYHKDVAQSSGFQQRHQSRPKQEQVDLLIDPEHETSPLSPSNGDRSLANTPPSHNNNNSIHSSSGLSSHRPLSGSSRGYVCSQCGKAFGRLHQFKLHQQSHRRKRTFWCTVCGKSFQCSSHLSIHYRTHTGEKPFGCGQCGKRFTQQSSLRVHQRTHSGERPYSCSLCGKTFILMHHLKRHRIIHTYS